MTHGSDDRRLDDLGLIYREHHAFVWRSLHHFGLRGDEISDAIQEVFIVVHRKFDEYDGHTPIRSWLYGIARRVGSDHRKRGQRRAARLQWGTRLDENPTKTNAFERVNAAAMVDRLLEVLDDDKREVFVLSEVEGMTAPEIAQALGVNLNTIYARLRAARLRFQRELERLDLEDRKSRAWTR